MSKPSLSSGPPQFPAFVFDLDGTLIDSLRDIAEAANAALRDLGFRFTPSRATANLWGTVYACCLSGPSLRPTACPRW